MRCLLPLTQPLWCGVLLLQVDLRSTEEIVKGGNVPAFQGASFCKFRRDRATGRVSSC